MSETVIDKLILLYETQGADKVNKELEATEKNADEAAQAYVELSETSLDLQKSIRDLSKEMESATGKENVANNKSLISLKKKLNATKADEAIAKKSAQVAKSQFTIAAKKQKEADRAAKVLTDKNQKLAGSFAAVASKAVTVAAPLAVFKKLLDTTLEFGREGQQLRLLGAFAGSDPQRIQLWGNALKSYGGDAVSASAMIGNLNQELQELRMTGTSRLWEAARRYGMDFSGSGAQGLATADELLEKIAKRMETLNTQQQLDFGRQLGLDASTIMLLQEGASGLDSALASAERRTVFSDEDIENSRRFKEEMVELTASLEKLKAVYGRFYMPLVTDWVSGAASEIDKLKEGDLKNSSLKDFLMMMIPASKLIEKAGDALKSTSTPLSSTNYGQPASGGGSGGGITIQGMTINTAATDAKGIADDIGVNLEKRLQSVVNQNYSGALA